MSNGVVVDSEALAAVTAAISDAGATLDAVADSMPGTGNTGAAELLVAAILADFAGVTVEVLCEGQLLADLANACNVEYESTDAAGAADMCLVTELDADTAVGILTGDLE